jgi:hypothetical protein
VSDGISTPDDIGVTEAQLVSDHHPLPRVALTRATRAAPETLAAATLLPPHSPSLEDAAG